MKHLEDEDIARLIDGKISKAERARLLEHLSRCDDCLTLYSETLEFMDQEKAPWWQRLTLPQFGAPFTRRVVVPAFAALLIILLLLPFLLIKSPTPYKTAWWIKKHGDYAKSSATSDARVGRAFAILERLKKAADKSGERMPRLAIIAAKKKAYAFALPEGGIIINPAALDICFDGVGGAEGDARLAFILGHELAHLADKDDLNRETVRAFQEYGKEKDLDADSARYKQQEIAADIDGALYAAMAGYKIGTLFAKDNDFLLYWAKQTGIDYDKDQTRHPAMQKRVLSIREHLSAVADKVELFRAGVLLFQVDAYHDAAAAFREFSKVYPAREVFNNIGACYLHLALHHLHLKFSKDYYRFRLATAIDYTTGAEALIARGEGDYLEDKQIAQYLAYAEHYFKKAGGRDAYDRACRYNLAAVLILKKEYERALAVCSEVLKQDPRDVNALNNKAVALFRQGEEGTTRRTLKKAHKLEPDNHEVVYNLAALEESRNGKDAAKPHWQNYLELDTTPRDHFYTHVYKKLHGTAPPRFPQPSGIPEMVADISLADDFAAIEKRWGKAYARTYQLDPGTDDRESCAVDLQVIVKGDIRVIALDGMIEIVEREIAAGQSSKEMLKRFGPAQKVIRHTFGHFYVYKRIGFSFKEIDGKVRSYIWFAKSL